MLKPKKRITKKEIKEDRLVTTYFETQTWFQENRKRLSTGFFTIVAVAAVLWFYYNNRATENQSATADLGNVMRFYDGGQYETAIKGFPQENVRGLEQIVSDYGSTESGEIAKLYLGNSYYASGNFEKALQYYQDADISDQSLMASAYAGIAACEVEMGNQQMAAEYFEKAAATDLNNFHTAEYLFYAAKHYAGTGEKKKAADLLERLKKKFPLSSFAREADRLAVLVRS